MTQFDWMISETSSAEIAKSVEPLSNSPRSPSQASVMRSGNWTPEKEETLAQAGEAPQNVAESDLARHIVRRDWAESLFELYARGQADELFAAATKLLGTAASLPEDDPEITRSPRDCLLHVLERRSLAEIRQMNSKDDLARRRKAMQVVSDRLQRLKPWDHLSLWQAVQAELQSLDTATDGDEE